MGKRASLAVGLALVVAAGLSCDNVTAPPTTGGIAIVLLSSSGANLAIGTTTADAPADLSGLNGTPTSLLLESVRVTVTGGTPSMTKSTTVTTPSGGFFQVSIADLNPGSYTVVVEGLIGGRVAHFGTTTNITVTAGATTPAQVTFPVFQPVVPNVTATDTVEVLRFTVSFSAVPSATSYVVEWSTSASMSSPQSKTVTTTTTEVTVPTEGRYFFTVRAANADLPAGALGLPSTPKAVQVIQTVTSVTVSPASPTITAGATQQFTFEARDADNAVVANPAVVWVSNNQAVATVSATGLATTLTSGTALIYAVAKGTPGFTTLTANPMPATKLTFTTSPVNTTAGQSIASVQVAIQNPQNQTATTDNTSQITLAFGTNAGSGTLGGTKTVTVVNGVATYNNLNVDKTGVGYTLTATSGTLASATSAAFNITPAGASLLAFATQPSAIPAGGTISPAVQVEVQDGLGNRAVGSSAPVTIAIAANPGSGVLSGTKIVNAINGVASFSGLSIDKSGTGYTLAATSAGLTAATSSTFNVAAGTQLAFTVGPTNSIAGAAVSPEIQVEIRDAAGNRVLGARDPVTIAIAANPGTGTLSGTKTVSAVNGVATFSGLSINKTGTGYTLSANATGLTAATSAAFNVGNAPLAQVVFTIQPQNPFAGGQFELALATQDAFGNVVPGSFGVTLSIGSNPGGGTLTGTTTLTTSNGVAEATDLVINKIGTGYTIVATLGTLSTATSVPINVLPGAPAKLVFLTQPSQSEPEGTMDAFQVAVLDAHDNATSAVTDVTLSVIDNPGGALVFGTMTVQSSGGIATFSDIILDSPGIGYTLQATAASVSSVTSNAFDVVIEFTSVRTGDILSCGTTTRRAAYCWGWGVVGSIGDNTGNSRTSPRRVVGPQLSAITVGWAHVCGILVADSTAVCWGHNPDGQVGNGVTNGPVGGSGWSTPQVVTGGHKFIAISAGASHTCAIRAVDSLAFCWGQQSFGRLGNAQSVGAAVANPAQVSGVNKFKTISAGHQHSCAVRNDGTGMCWGRQIFGRLGNGSNIEGSITAPVAIGGMTFLDISAGLNHSCGVRAGLTDRRGYCWGANGNAQLGTPAGADVAVPQEISNGLRYESIRVSGGSSCGVTTGGAGFCWGNAQDGKLGNGVTTGVFGSPQAVLGALNFARIEPATPGDSFAGVSACGRTTSGVVYCWGSPGGFGSNSLGDGTVLPSSVPVKVRGQR